MKVAISIIEYFVESKMLDKKKLCLYIKINVIKMTSGEEASMSCTNTDCRVRKSWITALRLFHIRQNRIIITGVIKH